MCVVERQGTGGCVVEEPDPVAPDLHVSLLNLRLHPAKWETTE